MSGLISRQGAERTKVVVERSERGLRTGPATGRAATPRISGLFYIKTTSSVGAATSATQWTSGTATFQSVDQTGAVTDTGQELTVWNAETGGSIASGIECVAAEVCGKILILWQRGAC